MQNNVVLLKKTTSFSYLNISHYKGNVLLSGITVTSKYVYSTISDSTFVEDIYKLYSFLCALIVYHCFINDLKPMADPVNRCLKDVKPSWRQNKGKSTNFWTWSISYSSFPSYYYFRTYHSFCTGLCTSNRLDAIQSTGRRQPIHMGDHILFTSFIGGSIKFFLWSQFWVCRSAPISISAAIFHGGNSFNNPLWSQPYILVDHIYEMPSVLMRWWLCITSLHLSIIYGTGGKEQIHRCCIHTMLCETNLTTTLMTMTYQTLNM